MVQKVRIATITKYEGVLDCGGRDETTAKNENYEGFDRSNKQQLVVSELLAADCEKAWLHEGLEDTMQKWYDKLEEMKKKMR